MSKIFKSVGKLIGGGGDDGARAEAEAARRIQEETARNLKAQQEALNNMQVNAQANLMNEDKATVVAGGSADSSIFDDPTKRKKAATGGIASTLGLNL